MRWTVLDPGRSSTDERTRCDCWRLRVRESEKGQLEDSGCLKERMEKECGGVEPDPRFAKFLGREPLGLAEAPSELVSSVGLRWAWVQDWANSVSGS